MISTGISQTTRMADNLTIDNSYHSDYNFCFSWSSTPVCGGETFVDVNIVNNPISIFYYSQSHTNYNSNDCGGHPSIHPGQSTTVWAWFNHQGACDNQVLTPKTVTLDALYPPVNVQATDGEFLDKVVLSWEKGTDRPDNAHQYYLERNGDFLTYVNGDIRSYEITGLTPDQTDTYGVYTVVILPGSTYFSSGVSDEGSTVSIIPEASDGEFYNKTKVTWNSLAHVAEDIRVERKDFGGSVWQELAIQNKNATSYSDIDGVPGFTYTYKITPIWSGTTFSGEDTGYSRPNGKISGNVRSILGAGVDSVEIYVVLADSISGGGAALPSDCVTTYCAMTDPSGYYEVEDIYYYTGADFIIYPQKGDSVMHEFNPDSLIRNLNENYKFQSGVDFVDETVLTVGGRVTFPLEQGQQIACGVEGVEIMINGKQTGVFTDDEGNWSTALSDQGTYSFSASLLDHVYLDAADDTTTTLYINEDKVDINFENKTLRTIEVVAQGGCFSSLGESVKFRVYSTDLCINRAYYTDAAGLLTIDDLPPRDEYFIQLDSILNPTSPSNYSNIIQQLNQEIEFDLRKLDTMEIITPMETEVITIKRDTLPDTIIVTIDTMLVSFDDTTYTTEKEIRFIYRSPIIVETSFEEAGAVMLPCIGNVMVQGHEYLLEFSVKELLGEECYIDTGTLVIYDEISDLETVRQRIPISNGIAYYLVKPGIPDLAESQQHSHEKFLYVIPEVDNADVDAITYWSLVTGIKSNTPSFITRTPEIPELVIHDPPGDESFAFIEKGTTFTTTSSTEIEVGGSFGGYLNFKAGPATNLFAAKIKAGGLVEFEAKGGRDNFDNTTITKTITFLTNYSTSSSETFVGNDGDVFIGSALNQTFALSQELKLVNCEPVIDTVVEMGYADFATTFIYTEYHIKNSLLPSLQTLLSLADTNTIAEKMEYNRLLADILLWDSIIIKNDWNRDSLAEFKENLSFSAGAEISKSHETTDGLQNSFTYNTFFETSLKVGVYAELEAPAVYVETEGGLMASFRYSQTEVRDTVDDKTRTVGYTLSDNDIGDYVSVNVLKDKAYDVPAFKIVAGATSCPREVNTQARENPDISVYPPIVNNIPPDQTAKFVLSITNNSESGETRQYAVKLVANSNPGGAYVNVAGSDVNVFPVVYYFDANQTIDLSMEVTKGPLDANYDSIGITIYSECELDIWNDGGSLNQADTTWFTVNFLSECTNVSMHLPNSNWLVNQASQNILHTAFTGYDLSNPLLQGLTLQIKKDGEGYLNTATIPKASLIGPYYDYYLDVTNFPDGNYTVRARANCGIDGGYTYSSEVTGVIDRNSIAPFGYPSPADGFLREGQEVSVTFDKTIDPDLQSYSPDLSLYRDDNGKPIAFTPQVFGNKVILFPDTALIDRTDLEGVLLNARVDNLQDLNGNVQEYPTEWSFLVNVSPVFWDPESIVASGMEGLSHTIIGVLKNTSLLSKAFSLDPVDAPAIIEYPDWLVPVQSRGTILPQNDYEVEFELVSGLTPGIYTGVVTAMVDSLPVSMDVTFELLASPVNWPFDPSEYQYTMNVVAQFSLDGTNNNLSADTRDLIGAFVNGQIRGVTNIEYIQDLNMYRAFLTIYSNNQGGGGAETVQFRFWHALNGVEYGALETVTFTLDATTGTVASPFILHPEGFFQVIPLNKGWNWISLNVSTSNMSREHIFQNILNSGTGNSITVKSKTQTTQYSPTSGWNGNLSTLQLGAGYLVYLSNGPDTLRVVGLPSASTIVVPLVNNWNWIGYPRLNPETVDDVLQDLTPVQGNILKSQFKFASYDALLDSWVGNLNFFSPGLGYKLFLSNTGNIVFQPSREDGYEVDASLYEYNMNVTGFADLDLIGERHEEDMIIGAFIDGQCRGAGKLEYIPAMGQYQALMLVNGNVADLGKHVEFKFKNETSGAEYIANGASLSFIADGLVGSVENPYEFFLFTTGSSDPFAEGYHLEQNKPNPVNGVTQIGFSLPVDDKVTIKLFDITGNPVKVLYDQSTSSGHHTVDVDLRELPNGIYFYEMKTAQFSGTKKLAKE